ncbi:MAG TPA: inositol monophosphatase [Phycisphaerales bacterium]|nr:inositol monophosphatase [Phycisphaerales bacterium]
MRQFLEEIITEAGRMTLAYRGRGTALAVEHKREKDLVSEADVAVERFLVEQIRQRYPQHAIFGEESGSHDGTSTRWLIDPIDGTTSFVRGQPHYSVSIAVEQAGKTTLAAVYAPALGELYLAERGRGATLNGDPIHVSSRHSLSDSVLATGFACIRRNSAYTNVPFLTRLLPQILDVRRYGSAAVDLGYVASGRLEGFWELDLKPYDVAAGFLVVEEAGGRCSDFAGGRQRRYRQVLATNGHIHDQVVAVFADVRRELAAQGLHEP